MSQLQVVLQNQAKSNTSLTDFTQSLFGLTPDELASSHLLQSFYYSFISAIICLRLFYGADLAIPEQRPMQHMYAGEVVTYAGPQCSTGQCSQTKALKCTWKNSLIIFCYISDWSLTKDCRFEDVHPDRRNLKQENLSDNWLSCTTVKYNQLACLGK